MLGLKSVFGPGKILCQKENFVLKISTLRHPPDILQTPIGQPPNFTRVGPFLLAKARCGFFFQWENKVKSYSNQLKWSKDSQVGVEFDKTLLIAGN